MTERELMSIKRDLQARARRMGLGKARTGAYVFGTLRRIAKDKNLMRRNPEVSTFPEAGLKIVEKAGRRYAGGGAEWIEAFNAATGKNEIWRHAPKQKGGLYAFGLHYLPASFARGRVKSMRPIGGGFMSRRVASVRKIPARVLRGNPSKCEEIYDDNWDDKEVMLVFEKTLKPVCIGQKVKDFRGDYAVVTGGRAPHKPSSEGKVWVREGTSESEYYPSVFDLKWVPSVNVFPIDKVTGKSRLKMNPSENTLFMSLTDRGGKKKTWHIGESAVGGIIAAKVSQNGTAVAIRNATYHGNETISVRLFRWPLDKFSMLVYLNELTTSYYADKIMDWVKGAAKG